MYGLIYCLVKWRGLPVHAATWEPLDEVQKLSDGQAPIPKNRSSVGPRLQLFARNPETSKEPSSKKRRNRAKKGNKQSNIKIKQTAADAETFENNDEESTSAAELHASQNETTACVESQGQPQAKNVDVTLGLRLPTQRICFDLFEYYKNFQLPQPLNASFRQLPDTLIERSCRETTCPTEGSKL
jgi:hypothetical protein